MCQNPITFTYILLIKLDKYYKHKCTQMIDNT